MYRSHQTCCGNQSKVVMNHSILPERKCSLLLTTINIRGVLCEFCLLFLSETTPAVELLLLNYTSISLLVFAKTRLLVRKGERRSRRSGEHHEEASIRLTNLLPLKPVQIWPPHEHKENWANWFFSLYYASPFSTLFLFQRTWS